MRWNLYRLLFVIAAVAVLAAAALSVLGWMDNYV